MQNYCNLDTHLPTMTYPLFTAVQKSFDDLELIEPLKPSKPSCLIFTADNDSRFLYKTFLKIWNYEVLEASTIEEVFEQTRYECPDVILMDTQINFTDSLLTMEKLKTVGLFNKTPFILLSGHAQPKIRQSAISAGAKDLCVKPVDFDGLERILENCLSYGN